MQTRTRETDQPVYWFLILDHAIERGDLDQAARARRELKRLGVDVTYRRPRERQEVASADH
jgi:hypothetical protein